MHNRTNVIKETKKCAQSHWTPSDSNGKKYERPANESEWPDQNEKINLIWQKFPKPAQVITIEDETQWSKKKAILNFKEHENA